MTGGNKVEWQEVPTAHLLQGPRSRLTVTASLFVSKSEFLNHRGWNFDNISAFLIYFAEGMGEIPAVCQVEQYISVYRQLSFWSRSLHRLFACRSPAVPADGHRPVGLPLSEASLRPVSRLCFPDRRSSLSLLACRSWSWALVLCLAALYSVSGALTTIIRTLLPVWKHHLFCQFNMHGHSGMCNGYDDRNVAVVLNLLSLDGGIC